MRQWLICLNIFHYTNQLIFKIVAIQCILYYNSVSHIAVENVYGNIFSSSNSTGNIYLVPLVHVAFQTNWIIPINQINIFVFTWRCWICICDSSTLCNNVYIYIVICTCGLQLCSGHCINLMLISSEVTLNGKQILFVIWTV